jgi:crotonobetainyl-CoA:carnitine CoA-transferase CaiB-like acyl-CoA transferase
LSDRTPCGPLSGVRVVELASVVMAPFAGQQLGDLGADVVKVEGFEGDSNRWMTRGPHPELSGQAINLHRNKRSIAIDLKSDAGHEIVLRLIAEADVVLTNMRPAALRRLRLDHASVAATAPGVVYVEAHGFAEESGLADDPAYDDTIQALTGLPMLQESLGSGVTFSPTLLADKLAAFAIVQGTVAALYNKAVTGQGQRVEIPMFDSVLSFMLAEHLAGAAFPGGRAGYPRILSPNRGPHRTADGWLAIMPHSDTHWHTLFTEAGCADLLQSPWHADMKTRITQADSAYGDLKKVLTHHTTAHWLDFCTRNDIPVAEVPTLDDIVADPQRHHGVLINLEHPVAGPYRAIRPPVRFHGTPTADVPRPAPLVGADGDEVLQALGYSVVEREKFYAGRVVRHPAPDAPSEPER